MTTRMVSQLQAGDEILVYTGKPDKRPGTVVSIKHDPDYSHHRDYYTLVVSTQDGPVTTTVRGVDRFALVRG